MTTSADSGADRGPNGLRRLFTEKMVKWIIFSVLMALVPLIASALSQATRGSAPMLHELVSRGELLLITAALCARSCGELFGSNESQRVPKLVAGGATIIVMLLAAIYFSDVTASYRASASLDVVVIARTSFALYAASVLVGASCILLSELRQ